MSHEPRDFRPTPIDFGGRRTMKPRGPIIVVLVLAGLLLLFGLFRLLCGVLVDYWWFRALGFGSVYTKVLFTKSAMWCVGFALTFGAAASGFLIARRAAGPLLFTQFGQMTVPVRTARRLVEGSFWAAAVVVGLVGGRACIELWQRVLLYLGRVSFGVADPIFQNDVGFYVFVYPLVAQVRVLVMVLVFVSLISSGIYYALAGVFVPGGARPLRRTAVSHAGKGLAAVCLLMAAGFFLDRYALLYSTTGVVFGPGYADVHGLLPAYWVMVLASVGVAVVLALPDPLRRPRVLVGAAGVWLGCLTMMVGIWPGFLQKFRVEANELALEREYISHNIEQTLQAYDLADVKQLQYPVKEALSYAEVVADTDTMGNVRLWDWRPLKETYRQLQEMRPYYEFVDVDVDRYEIGGRYTQTLLAVRELNTSKLQAQAQTWVNTRLQFTHGYGLCMSPVNEQTEEGYPELIVRDFPPVTPEGLELDQPQIYYGERTSDYVLVNADEAEFDYPTTGEENALTRYTGTGGVSVRGLLRKLVFALQFQDVKIMLSDDLNANSRIMYRRLIAERVSRIAPYLILDRSPYPVIHDGRIQWIQDAYTWTRYYPYSEPTGRSGLNYIRNSVKVVVDAYDGSVTFYMSDDSDPIIAAYSRIFPGVYRPMSEMPAALREHIRYPLDYFSVQTAKYAVYHMQDPRVFYNREDAWDVPLEKTHGQEVPVESYYIIMRLPGQDEPEFILMLPFTPRGRDNMISWLAGRCDGEYYGELLAYAFAKERLIYGPRQVEARIDQDPDISQQLTLWGQSGSSVIRGNLVVIPIADGILYVEPLYIRAEDAAQPQLKRVITAYGERVSMAPTLEESLLALFGQTKGEPEAAPAQAAAPVPSRRDDDTARVLIQGAVQEYERAQEAMRAGDWAEYGRRMESMKARLDALQQRLSQEE